MSAIFKAKPGRHSTWAANWEAIWMRLWPFVGGGQLLWKFTVRIDKPRGGLVESGYGQVSKVVGVQGRLRWLWNLFLLTPWRPKWKWLVRNAWAVRLGVRFQYTRQRHWQPVLMLDSPALIGLKEPVGLIPMYDRGFVTSQKEYGWIEFGETVNLSLCPISHLKLSGGERVKFASISLRLRRMTGETTKINLMDDPGLICKEEAGITATRWSVLTLPWIGGKAPASVPLVFHITRVK